MAAAEAKRAGAFPTKAETAGQKVMNFGKAGAMHSAEAKIKAELAIVDRQIRGHKQNFGIELFTTLAEAEDTRGYLPTDRQVRSIYDQTRQDIQSMEAKKKLKEEELISLGATVNEPAPIPQQSQQQGSYSDVASAGGGGYSDNPTKSSDEMEDMLL